ncbi:ribokinase [Pseudooceanicola aestuarii]|uniref:ribokinase n=1 Tax=Pseudooceanicola aestuarii TaxID=2697319 RepID=UPI0013D53D0C|nr:ribokinase [Pseudooceanicola aestuarii]
MTIWNLGSVNADLVYRLPHLPVAGETLTATGFAQGLGGKGANMSVAAARAGSMVQQIGAVGQDGIWMRDRLADYGVGVDHIAVLDGPSGQAIIAVDDAGENQIIILGGANRQIDDAMVAAALDAARPGDIAITQNETTGQQAFARLVRARGLRLAYAAAPFEATAVAAMLDHLDLLVMNQVEADQLTRATGTAPEALPVADVVITRGGAGCRWIATGPGTTRDVAAPRVTPVDTTGAGDTFTGYLVAGLDQGLAMADALDLAQRAAALMVTRHGTADVIPRRDEV